MALFKKKSGFKGLNFKSLKGKKTAHKKSSISKLSSPYRSGAVDLPSRKRTKIRTKPAISGPSQMRNKPKNSRGKIFLAGLLSIGIIGYSTYTLFFSGYLLIENFQIEEEGTIISDYQKMTSILQKIIGQNLLLIDENALIREIQQSHPEIETIAIEQIFPKTIKIQYRKFPTVANMVNIAGGVQKKFIVDSQGFLIEENTEHPGLPYIHFETPEMLTFRSNFLSNPKRSRERLTQILQAINLFEEKFGMKIVYAEFEKREREVHLVTEKYFTVMLDLEKDLLRQMEKLKKALEKLDIYNVPLQYIDLRISGTDTEKVIFKRK